MIKFIVYGKIVPKGRPRFSMRGRFPHAYTPKRTKEYEELVALTAREAGVRPHEGPVSICVRAYIPTKDKALNMKPHISARFDLDNVCKSLMDALNNVAWIDDTQVYSIDAKKFWSFNPRLEVVIDYQ